MNRRRLALVFVTIPFAVYAWACSSDSSDTPANNDAGTNPTSTTPTPNPPPPTDPPPNPPPPPPSDGGDAGTDAGPSCVGNPLTFDGGTPDGGAILDAAVAVRILDEPTVTGLNSTFVDGPQFFDFNGGALVFSELYGPLATLVRIQPDGGARTVIRTATAGNQFFIGSAARDGGLISTFSLGNGAPGDAGITNTSLNGDAGALIGTGASNNPNDVAVGPKGDLYITDPQYQVNNAGTLALYRVAPNGTVTQTTTTDRPNGIGLSPDGSKLYVSANNTNANTRKVYAYPIAADGSITNTPTTLVPTTADPPDGLAVDVGGNVWVAEASGNAQSGRVEVFSPSGAKLGEIPFPTTKPTGVAFGGADNKTLFVTVETGIYVFSSRCAGIR